MHTVVITLDLLGTFVFALSGAAAGVQRRLDLFGVLVLAFVAAVSGGVLRDLLIGAVPPAAVADWHYLGVSAVAGVLAFYGSGLVGRLRLAVLMLDAIGLSLFAVAGAAKAMAFHLHPLMAIVMGGLTGIGGGMVRDVLLSEVPTVLRADLYAVAALAGAGVFVGLKLLGFAPVFTVSSGAIVCLLLRTFAIRFRWHLPTASRSSRPIVDFTESAEQTDKF